MKKRDNIFKKYLITLTLVFCAFTLVVGLFEANSETSFMTSGVAEKTVTEKQISEFITESIDNGKRTVSQAVNNVLTKL